MIENLIGLQLSNIEFIEKVFLLKGFNVKDILKKKDIFSAFEKSSFTINRNPKPGSIVMFTKRVKGEKSKCQEFGYVTDNKGFILKFIGVKKGIVVETDMIFKFNFMAKESVGTIIEGFIQLE